MGHSLEHNSTDYEHASKGVEVFVGGLARSLTEDKVQKVFSSCGEIMDMRLIKDQKGNMKGFGFVRFVTKEAADRAIKELSGSTLEGKKIGVLPSSAQDTLFLGNLNKGWSADDFDKVVRQVFPEVASIDLAMPLSGDETTGKKIKNRGFAFVKFSSHAAAARAYRAGSKPGFVLGGNFNLSVQWAEEATEVNPDELAKIKIAFVRNLPRSADENYLTKLFLPFGKLDKVVVSNKGQASVGFIHFTQRSHLDNAIKELNEKIVQGPKGGPSFKLQVEVARPLEKKRKRVHEDSRNNEHSEILSQSKHRSYEPAFEPFDGREATVQKESIASDPYEAAVLLLPVAVKERLLRILRLGIATRFDMDIQSLTGLAELPESTALLILDQFMLSGADKHNKGAYLAGLISRYQVEKPGVDQLPSSLSRLGDTHFRESVGLSGGRRHLPTVDSHALHVSTSVPRSDSYASRYSTLYLDYPLSSRSGVIRTEERSPVVLHELPGSSNSYGRYGGNLPAAYLNTEDTSPIPSPQIQASSLPYGRGDPVLSGSLAYGNAGPDPRLAPSIDSQSQPSRPQMRFDPFTGQPYKFDPFTGEPIVPESLPRRYGSPY